MPRSFEEIRQMACELPEEQRILLANLLWESVDRDEDDATEEQIEAAWDAEIERRIEELDSGAVEAVPAEKVLDEMLARLSPEARARLKR